MDRAWKPWDSSKELIPRCFCTQITTTWPHATNRISDTSSKPNSNGKGAVWFGWPSNCVAIVIMSTWFLDVSGSILWCWRKSLSPYATISLPTSLTISGILWAMTIICQETQSDSWQIAQRCFAPLCRATWFFSISLPNTKPLNSMFHNILNFY